MSITRIVFLARHGETDWNAAGRWQGQTDVPLNAKGRAQARALAACMGREGIAAIASSDLSRARSTAEIVAEELALGLSVDPDLREQRFGRFEGLTRMECEAQFPDDWARYVASHGAPPEGESHEALLARVLPAVIRVAQLASPALVVMHGGAMRAVLHESLRSLPTPASSGWPRHGIPNGGVFRLCIASGRIVAATRVELALDREQEVGKAADGHRRR